MKLKPGKILLLWFLLTPCLGQAADLKLYINRETLTEGESFTLEIETHLWASETPDLSPLQQDFEILTNRRSSTFRLLQGQRKQENRWQLELSPKRTGLLRIPPIRIGNSTTPERFITVRSAGQATHEAAQGAQPVFIEVKVEPDNPYVHAQALYTAYLHISTQLSTISNASLSEPTPKEGAALVEQMEGAKYTKRIGNQSYTIYERRYLVTPQSSGVLSFAPLEFKARVGGRREWVLDWSDFGLKRAGPDARTFIKRSKPLELTVRSIPPEYPPDAQWLPARSLSLQAKWVEAMPSFAPGVPVTRLFELTADGLAAAQLQLPQWRLPGGARVYPDQPQYKTRKHAKGTIGILHQGIALIPTVAGELSLPMMEVPWWNVWEERLEYARVPVETITVTGSMTSEFKPPPASMVASNLTDFSLPDTTQAIVHHSNPWWPLLSALLAFAWLSTLALWWRYEHRTSGITQKPEEISTRPPPKYWAVQLHDACLKGNPSAARAALQGWVWTSWPDEPHVNMAALAERFPLLAKELAALDRILYRPDAGTWHGGDALWNTFLQCRKLPQEKPAQSRTYLKPLYS